MSNLEDAPEVVVENMMYQQPYCRFTEDTLYYEPCLYEYVDASERGSDGRIYTAVDISGGKLLALDLETGESKVIVGEDGIVIYPQYAWGDLVVFSAWPCKVSGLEISGDNSKLHIAYSSGKPHEYLCEKSELGRINRES